MPIISYNQAGKVGLVTDIPSHELAPAAWSAATNMHFVDGYAEKVPGYRDLFGGASVAPYFVSLIRSSVGSRFVVYAGETSIWAYDETTHTDITRVSGAYSAAGMTRWQGGLLNGVPIFNNGVDVPQMWVPFSVASKLQDLTAWPAGVTAKVIRAYKNYLIALDVTKSGVRDPRLVKWSHAASAGAVPTSWDEADTTKDAGEYSLADTEGMILDCVQLRDTNIIYKDDGIWGMSYVGGAGIFRFFNIFRNVGALAKDCAVEFQQGKHLVFGKDDVFVHDGQTIVSITRGLIRKEIYSNINPELLHKCFVVMDTANSEVWICYPETGKNFVSIARIWNWATGAWGTRELPNVSSIASGVLNPGSEEDTWSGVVDDWGSDNSSWGSLAYNPSQQRLLMAVPESSKLYGVLPEYTTAAGEHFESYLERSGLGVPFNAQEPPDISSMKFCSRIWPRITGTTGEVVQVRFGSQLQIGADPQWGAWKDFIIGTSTKVDVTVSGRLFAVAFRTQTSFNWKLHGFELDVQKLGEF